MKTIVLLFFVLNVFAGCQSGGSADPLHADADSTKVLVRYKGSSDGGDKVDRAGFIKKFDNFYKDKDGRFFIKAYGNQRQEGLVLKYEDVFIEIPELDSASYVNMDMYLKDASKVICILLNSDGGNYVELNDADPKTFQAFKSAYGGKDKNNVFFRTKKLTGLNPSAVKVHHTMKGCSNCTAYFTDGKVCYLGEEKKKDNCSVPAEFDLVEE